jgi:ribosomal-protein-serine acetyltransferase
MRCGTSLSPALAKTVRTMTETALLPLDLGHGLALVPTTAADAADAYAVIVAERGRLREWLPWVDGTTGVSVERDYLHSVELANTSGTGLHATIRLDDSFAGFVGLRLDLLHRSAEVGYWLAGYAEGRGIMTRAVSAMFELAFADLAMHRVELLAATANQRSRAIAERLGMRLEGIRREAEELPSGWVDLAMYALLAQDWPGDAVAVNGSN